MRYQVVETKVFVVEAEDETAAQMATDALQNEMQMAERSFEAAKNAKVQIKELKVHQ